MREVCGFTRLTSSGIVGDSGKSVDVYGWTVESGGTAAAPYIKNGTAVSSPAVTGMGPNTISQANHQDRSVPFRCPLGCFVSFDTNTTAVTIFWGQTLT
jgi:hypothetical protein